jgi:hypothetical protein
VARRGLAGVLQLPNRCQKLQKEKNEKRNGIRKECEVTNDSELNIKINLVR